eukprot:TRINITY_DN27058_c0_g1_i1.p1 TRINITY_DN27058_c0_g1~~TRINITY_DN27058_c0_g1_i1.p1  ORF type:complete len:366 (-),score=27.33 TRINITY_DN27058_c0_g1_i1:289-1386(-)
MEASDVDRQKSEERDGCKKKSKLMLPAQMLRGFQTSTLLPVERATTLLRNRVRRRSYKRCDDETPLAPEPVLFRNSANTVSYASESMVAWAEERSPEVAHVCSSTRSGVTPINMKTTSCNSVSTCWETGASPRAPSRVRHTCLTSSCCNSTSSPNHSISARETPRATLWPSSEANTPGNVSRGSPRCSPASQREHSCASQSRHACLPGCLDTPSSCSWRVQATPRKSLLRTGFLAEKPATKGRPHVPLLPLQSIRKNSTEFAKEPLSERLLPRHFFRDAPSCVTPFRALDVLPMTARATTSATAREVLAPDAAELSNRIFELEAAISAEVSSSPACRSDASGGSRACGPPKSSLVLPIQSRHGRA